MDDHTGAIRCTFCWSAFSEPLLRCRQSGTSATPPMLLLVWLLNDLFGYPTAVLAAINIGSLG